MADKKTDIKIFVSHRIDLDSQTVNNPLYIPVRCGAVYDKRENVEMLGDDTGDNISDKRLSFCELTVQYWAWKNVDADYYGLCHYRRYLSFSDEFYSNIDANNHVIEKEINEDFIDKFGLNEKNMERVISQYDIITLVPLQLDKIQGREKIRVYDSLVNNPAVFRIDIVNKFIDIFKSKYPDFTEDIDQYFSGYTWRAFNCYVMRKEYFQEYNEMLFNVLFELDSCIDKVFLNQEQLRIVGYMGEAMFGIYYNHLKRCLKKIRTKEVQLVKIENTNKKVDIHPAFKEKNIPIVMASSDAYVSFLSVLLQSIKENASKNYKYDIIVLTQDMREKNKKLITNTFCDSYYFSIRFFDANTYLASRKLHTSMHITPMTYLRLAIPDLLKNYEKAIYLDCDIVINGDISELYNIDLSDYMIGAARDTVMAGWSNVGEDKDNENVMYNYEVVGIKNKFDYFNAGVIVVNLNEFRKNYSTEKLFDIACSRDWKWFDQDVLNKVCCGRTLFISNEWNVMAHCYDIESQLSEYFAPYDMYMKYRDAVENPKAIHYAGRFIPCFTPTVDDAEYFWHYAKKVPYYELILSGMISNMIGATINYEIGTRINHGDKKKPLYRRIAQICCPLNTRRRMLFDIIIPPQSIRRRICKRVYYLLKLDSVR